MIANRCLPDIVIIQGDTFQRNVFIEGLEDLSSINSVYFTCSKLNLEKELPFDSDINAYKLLFTPEETKQFKSMVTDFDITIKITENVVKTGIYRGKLIIADKNNPVGVYDNAY